MFNFIKKIFKKITGTTEKKENTVNNAAVNNTVVTIDNSYPKDNSELSIKPYAFKLSPLESWRYDNFVKEHMKHNGLISVSFKPNGIGIQVTCQCTKCKQIKDITEYEAF